MTGTIFSNLPNNLIMNIIKMAEDERKKDEAIQKTKNNFKNVAKQINEINREIQTFYFRCILKPTLSNCYASLTTPEKMSLMLHNHYEPSTGCIYDCNYYEWIYKINVFDYIENSNEEIEAIKEREQYEKERYEDELMDDPEYRREMMAEQDYYEVDECDYDWGDYDEPSWACE